MKRIAIFFGVLLGIGLVGLSLGALLEPAAAVLTAYLGAFAYALSLALGSLLLLLVIHLTGARWLIVYRRPTELVATSMLPLAVIFLPVLFFVDTLYIWALPLDALPEHLHHAIEHKRPWLNVPFFIVRSLLYFAIWIAAAELLLRFSLRQNRDEPSTTRRLRATAGWFAWPMVLSFTFATIDWFMSIDPSWMSTMYPVYFFAGGFLATLALLGLIPIHVQNTSHLHSLGKLELTFVIFWAYVAFAQFMLIWIADLPHEVTWYLTRILGVWGVLAVILFLGHFVFPFLLLLSRPLKRRRLFLRLMGAWLLFVHWIDIVWLIVPSSSAMHAEYTSWWLHIVALAAVVGLTGLYLSWRAVRHPADASSDPFFDEAVRYETQ